jgi:tetratricopeptide (TPR) repeat protein
LPSTRARARCRAHAAAVARPAACASPERLDLLEGGRDADPRQQTLRATVEWSYDLLDENERRLLAWLSVFAGGCTYESAERVCRADPNTLQSLIDKSLLRRRDTDLGSRYWMLETIREFGSERLEASGDGGEARSRFLADLLALAEEVPFGLRLLPWLRRVAAESDNIDAALAVEPPGETHLRLASALMEYWFWSGRNVEGRSELERLLGDVADASDRTGARARCVVGLLAMLEGDLDDAEHSLDACVATAVWRDMRPEQVTAHLSRGMVFQQRGELERAERALEEALTVAHRSGLVHFRARILRRLSLIALQRGDRQRTRALQQECLTAARGADDVVEELIVCDIAWQAAAEGDYETARRTAEDHLASQDASRAYEASLEHTLAVALLGLDRAPEADEVGRSGLRKAWARRDLLECAALIDLLSGSAALLGDDVRAARLAAAAERLLRDAGIADDEVRVARSVYRPSLEIARDRAGESWAVETLRGAALDASAAVELGLGDPLPSTRAAAPKR